jgi:hypothetical protein
VCFTQRPLSQREAEIRELVVEALSRLISANPESGVKHSLSMAYDPDPRQRLIFSYVFARVMGQGAKFEAQEPPVNFSGRSRLCEVCVLIKAQIYYRCLICCYSSSRVQMYASSLYSAVFISVLIRNDTDHPCLSDL